MYFVRFVLLCTDAVNDFLAKNCPFIAGAIAFYTLFSLFPLFLATISISGFVLGSPEKEAQLARRMSEVIPVSAEYIGRTVEGIVSARAITGAASVLGLLWAATAAFGAMRKGINAAWGITRTRPFLKERAIDVTLVIGAALFILALLVSTPIIEYIRELSAVVAPDEEPPVSYLWSLVARLTTPVLTFVNFVLLYRFLPNTKVAFADVWMGALLASMAFLAGDVGIRMVRKHVPSLQCGLWLGGRGDGFVDLGVRVGYHTSIRRPHYIPLRPVHGPCARRAGHKRNLDWYIAC